MTDLDRALVRRKLATIAQNLSDLEPIGALAVETYRGDRLRRKAAERLLQELIEAAVDTSLHILRAIAGPVPEDYCSIPLARSDNRRLSKLEPAGILESTWLQ